MTSYAPDQSRWSPEQRAFYNHGQQGGQPLGSVGPRPFYGQPRMPLPQGDTFPLQGGGGYGSIRDRLAALRQSVSGAPLQPLPPLQQRYPAQPPQEQTQPYASRPVDLAYATGFWGKRLASMSPSDPRYGEVQELVNYLGSIPNPAVNTPQISGGPVPQQPAVNPGMHQMAIQQAPQPAGGMLNDPMLRALMPNPTVNSVGPPPGAIGGWPGGPAASMPQQPTNPLWPSNPANVAPNQQITPGYTVMATHRQPG